jgi:hypothetical protein
MDTFILRTEQVTLIGDDEFFNLIFSILMIFFVHNFSDGVGKMLQHQKLRES